MIIYPVTDYEIDDWFQFTLIDVWMFGGWLSFIAPMVDVTTGA